MKKRAVFILAILFCTQSVFSQGVAINESGASPDASAALDISSSGKGTLITRLTTEQRDAIQSPAEGLAIFNSTTKCFEFYAYYMWQTMSCGVCPVPATPPAGVHNSTETSVTWNWNTVNGALGYKYNTSDNYGGAVDIGPSTSYVQSGLTCNNSYTLYVWAYNNCGYSATAASFTTNTLACSFACGSNITITHTTGSVAPETKTITYGTVSTNLSGSPMCWITQNLGADNAATSSLDGSVNNAGWRWQFNRPQGYKNGPIPTWTITSINENSNWVSGNDPCTLLLGSGWRLPTGSEWTNVDSGWANAGDSFNSVLKVHAAGFLESGTGNVNCQAWCGLYWSSTQYDNTNGTAYYNGNSWSQVQGQNKAYGYTLRCLR